MSNIEEKLKKWASEAYNFYRPKAEELNMDFYTQSDLSLLTDDKPVELMIIGINPGFGGNFKKDRFACSDDLLKGNIYKDENDQDVHNILNWKIIKDVRTILDYSGLGNWLDDESRFVLTNATFFSTHNEKGLAGIQIKKAQEDSIKYTKKLIEIIRPKHIICLGGKNCMNLLMESTQPMLSNIVKLDYGTISNIPVYGINHTSYFWTAEEKELVGKTLGVAFNIDAAPIEHKAFEKKTKAYIDAFKQKRNDRDNIKFESSLRWQYIYVSLCNHCMYQLGLDIHEKAKDETWTRFSVKNQDGANILILSIINQANDKSICVRFLNQDSTQNDAESILASLQRVDEKFKSMGSWIGKIDLSKSLSDTDTFIIETKKLLTNIIAEISNCTVETG